LKIYIKIFLLVGIFFLAGATNAPEEDMSFSTKTDYVKVFGDNYNKANSFIKTRADISLSFLKNGISPGFAWAIVFPELIRYNSIKDKLELASLYTLYINFGESYANFSVGNFQMKPSFARSLEADYLKNRGKLLLAEDFSFDTCETRKARAERIKRLDDINWQTKYLSIFIKLLDYKYDDEVWDNAAKLKFYATAYNAGYWLPKDEIRERENKKCFYIGLFNNDPDEKFNYALISDDYFSHSGHKQ
jgi:hypothetical protein